MCRERLQTAGRLGIAKQLGMARRLATGKSDFFGERVKLCGEGSIQPESLRVSDSKTSYPVSLQVLLWQRAKIHPKLLSCAYAAVRRQRFFRHCDTMFHNVSQYCLVIVKHCGPNRSWAEWRAVQPETGVAASTLLVFRRLQTSCVRTGVTRHSPCLSAGGCH